MLREIYIKNIALIDELRIPFSKGFNVLSGETGAGKSIIIDSMGLICGLRAERELISTGSESAYVEALFDTVGTASEVLVPFLSELGIEPEDGSIIISRELHQNGRSICRINGRLQTLTSLRSVALCLLNIHGQNQLGEVLDSKNHLSIIDSYGNTEIEAVKQNVSKLFIEYTSVKKKIDSIKISEAERARMLDMYSYQVKEIENAKLAIGEEDELKKRRDEMLNSQKIADALNRAYSALSENAMSWLMESINALNDASKYSDRATSILNTVSDAYYTIEDQSFELAKLKDGLTYSEAELEEIEDRRHLINSLLRKYGGTSEAVLEYYEEISEKLYELENSEVQLEELNIELNKKEKQLKAESDKLSALRKKYAEVFSNSVASELTELGMSNAKVSTEFREKAFSKDGTDDMEFLISVNRGEPLKPLAKVVSGGEASRIMLAIKVISAAQDGIGTLIFDEIDAGISGKIALVVAKKMARLASIRQVVCVTHLSQLASMADTNFFIEKTSDEAKTRTSVKVLDSQETENEVARLAGGSITAHAIEHARELISEAREYKKTL